MIFDSESIETVLEMAKAVAPDAIRLRRQIHQHPELGNQEVKTADLVAETLNSLGIEVLRPVGTSVVGVLKGDQPGKTIALRADMDALPVQELADVPFKSENSGCMHACGHDFHTAGLLGAAMVLSRYRDRLKGNVKFFFQPDEEDNGGAQRMMAAGCMENPHVDAVIGAHVDPDLPAGYVGFKYGKAYAASDTFTVVIRGKGCHGASPQDGIDAIAIGAQVVSALQQIASRRVSPTDSAVVTVGAFHAGTAGNIIAPEATLKGILRTLGADMRINVRKWFADTVNGICSAMGAQADIQIRESYPGIVNWNEMVDFAKNVAEAAIGSDRVHVQDQPTMGTEDFGYFIQGVPGVYYKIGVGNPEIGAVHPIHSPLFIADEAAMAHLVGVHAAIAMAYLQK